MAAAKKKKKKLEIQASDVKVDNRTLDGVLREFAEMNKDNAARIAELAARSREHEARMAALTARSARNEELITIALQTIAANTQDIRALAQRTDDRLGAVEKAVAAE